MYLIKGPDDIVNIIAKQGESFALSITVNMNLISYSSRGQIRDGYGLSASLIKAFNCVVQTIDTTSGLVLITLSATDTSAIPAYKTQVVSSNIALLQGVGVYYYDIEIYTLNDADVKRILQGKIIFDPEVTV